MYNNLRPPTDRDPSLSPGEQRGWKRGHGLLAPGLLLTSPEVQAHAKPVTDLGQQQRERRRGRGRETIDEREGKGRLSISVIGREQIPLQIKPYRCAVSIDF